MHRLQRSSSSGDFFDDVSGLGGPDERFGVGIVPVQAGFDASPELGGVAKQAEADGASVIRPKKRSTRLIGRLHEVNLASSFAVAFTDLRTGEAPESRSLLRPSRC